MPPTLQEAVFKVPVARWSIALAMLCRARWQWRQRHVYRALNDFCWVWRVSNVAPLRRAAWRVIDGVVKGIRDSGRNTIAESYHRDPASARCASLYLQSGGGPHDLLRDLIVLKSCTPTEKGVILLKYVRTFDAVVSMLDLDRLMEHYTFVLEPCWAGYCDPSLLMYLRPGQPVVVQCFTAADEQFISDLGAPFVPVRLGPADWVNADLFKPAPAGAPPAYDLVMVANWGRHKRHHQLFRALRQIGNRRIRVLLIGFPWSGRTADDIRREARAIGNDRIQIEIVESIPAAEVARHVSQCKVFVFLSRKEGDNKALVEAMFANVPAIVFDKTVGGAGSRVNAATGLFASDEDLAARIAFMLDHHAEFSPRAWALEHTGSLNATRILNEAIKRATVAAGGSYTVGIVEKTNAPNLAYRDRDCRVRFQSDYEFILACRRAGAGRVGAAA